MRGAYSESSARGLSMVASMMSRICNRPTRACSSASFIIAVVTLGTLMSICSAVMPSLGSGHLEVHIAVVIFGARDVGQNRIVHRLPSPGPSRSRPPGGNRHTGIHQRQSAAANAGHRTRTVRFQNVAHHTNSVREAFSSGITDETARSAKAP